MAPKNQTYSGSFSKARAICVCRVLATGASKAKLRPGDAKALASTRRLVDSAVPSSK